MTFEEFIKPYTKLCFGLDKTLSEGQALTYFEALKNFKEDQLRYAVSQFIKTAIFFPKPKELLEEIKNMPKKYTETQLTAGNIPDEKRAREYLAEAKKMLNQKTKVMGGV